MGWEHQQGVSDRLLSYGMRRLLPLVLGLSLTASATTWAPPRLMLIGSDYGSYGFKLLPQGVHEASASAHSTYGELVQLLPNGNLNTIWKQKMPNFPAKVLISPRGQVVTLDNYAGHGEPKNALVVYGAKGQILAQYTYADLFPNCQFCGGSGGMAAPYLATQFKATWAYYDVPHLALRDENGKGPTINLVTGKIKTSWNGQERR